MQQLKKAADSVTESWWSVKRVIQANTTWNIEVGKGAVEPKRTYRPSVGSRQGDAETATTHQKAIHLPVKEEFVGNQRYTDWAPFHTHHPQEYDHPQSDQRNFGAMSFNGLQPEPIWDVVIFEEQVWNDDAMLVPKSEYEEQQKLLARE